MSRTTQAPESPAAAATLDLGPGGGVNPVRQTAPPTLPSPGRNLLLDFFRGWALLVIFVNHIPVNGLSLFTPSRFGLSDASEIFVFLSGFAAALAYGRSFRSAGLVIGSAPVLVRGGQIYAAHLGLFFALAAICVIGDAWLAGPDYVSRLNLDYFFDHTPAALLGLVTLTYVPNYFDILPMYLVVLLWLPLFWALSRLHVGAALGASLGVYLAMWWLHIELPADPLGDRPWFFNPFGWQFLFFLGFAFGSGWIKAPASRGWLIALALGCVVIAIPIGYPPIYQADAFWGDLRATLEPWFDKTRLGPLRILHFICLAYLAVCLLRTRQHWLTRALPSLIATAGQQSLSIFLFGMALSFLAGMALDQAGRTLITTALVNLGGIALLLLAAQALAWLGQKPWKQAARALAHAATDSGGAPAPTGALGLPWVWLRHGTLAAALVFMAVSPTLLVRQVHGLRGPAAAVAAELNVPTPALPVHRMSPLAQGTDSLSAQILRAKRSSAADHPVDRQPGIAGTDPALVPVSLKPKQAKKPRRDQAGASRSKLRKPTVQTGTKKTAVRRSTVPTPPRIAP